MILQPVWSKRIHTENETWYNYSELRFNTHTHTHTHTHCFDCFIWSPTSFFLLLKMIAAFNEKNHRVTHANPRFSPFRSSAAIGRNTPDFIPVGERANDGSTHWRVPPYWIVSSGSRVCRVPGACPPEAGAHRQSSPRLHVSHMGWELLTDSLQCSSNNDSFDEHIAIWDKKFSSFVIVAYRDRYRFQQIRCSL